MEEYPEDMVSGDTVPDHIDVVPQIISCLSNHKVEYKESHGTGDSEKFTTVCYASETDFHLDQYLFQGEIK